MKRSKLEHLISDISINDKYYKKQVEHDVMESKSIDDNAKRMLLMKIDRYYRKVR